MKKFVPYLLGALALIVLVVIAVNTPRKQRKMDERITLRQHDKIPYGTYVAHRLLQATFSRAHVSFDKAPPGYWEAINTDTSNQAVFLVSENFDPSDDEMKALSQFVQRGNYVFVITQNIGWDAARFFSLEDDKQFVAGGLADSLTVSLQAPLAAVASYVYPGKRFDSYFSAMDSSTTMVLGRNGNGQTNFVELQSGNGKIFFHLAPLAFSNYFILHKNNIHYFQKVLSLIPAGVDIIVWNEYYLNRRPMPETEPSVLRVLWQYQAFRLGLLTTMATLLVYVLSTMRRRQRLIPFYTKPANDSLDFVRTMGRLYYDRKDHHNLAKKMTLFFMEHVRGRYKLANLSPDDLFATELHQKSHYDYEELKKIVDFIQYLETNNSITDQELARFYRQLNLFYKTTNGTIV